MRALVLLSLFTLLGVVSLEAMKTPQAALTPSAVVGQSETYNGPSYALLPADLQRKIGGCIEEYSDFHSYIHTNKLIKEAFFKNDLVNESALRDVGLKLYWPLINALNQKKPVGIVPLSHRPEWIKNVLKRFFDKMEDERKVGNDISLFNCGLLYGICFLSFEMSFGANGIFNKSIGKIIGSDRDFQQGILVAFSQAEGACGRHFDIHEISGLLLSDIDNIVLRKHSLENSFTNLKGLGENKEVSLTDFEAKFDRAKEAFGFFADYYYSDRVEGCTLLHKAVSNWSQDKLSFLCRQLSARGLNSIDLLKITPLHSAVTNKNVEASLTLIDFLEPDQLDKVCANNNTAFDEALKANLEEVMVALVKKLPFHHLSVFLAGYVSRLEKIIKHGNLKLIEALMERFNQNPPITCGPMSFQNPLQLVVEHKNINIARTVISGLDPSRFAHYFCGWHNPLSQAIEDKSYDIAKLLIEKMPPELLNHTPKNIDADKRPLARLLDEGKEELALMVIERMTSEQLLEEKKGVFM